MSLVAPGDLAVLVQPTRGAMCNVNRRNQKDVAQATYSADLHDICAKEHVSWTAMKTIESRITLDANPEEVWRVLFDFAGYPEWNPFVPRMEARLAEGEPFKAIGRLPSRLKLGFVGHITGVVPHTSVVWEGRPKLLPAMAMRFRHSFTLERAHGGTHLHQREEAEGLMIPVSGWILGQAQKGQVELNDALANRLAQTA